MTDWAPMYPEHYLDSFRRGVNGRRLAAISEVLHERGDVVHVRGLRFRIVGWSRKDSALLLVPIPL